MTDLLQQAFEKEYQEAFQGVAAGNMFLGGNTGFLSKTLLAMLAPDKDTAKILSRYCWTKVLKLTSIYCAIKLLHRVLLNVQIIMAS